MAVDLEKFYRWAAFGVSCALFYMSVTFSIKGFNFETNSEYAAYGAILAVSCTIMELIWNYYGDKSSWTIRIIGILCYGYGIWTNVLGISSGRGGVDIFSIALGLILEIAPEPLFVLALVGNNRGQGGFFENLVGKAVSSSSQPQKQQQAPQQSHQKQQYHPQSGQDFKRQDRPMPTRSGVPSMEDTFGGPPELRRRIEEVNAGNGKH